jgi:hypothetical protein
MLPVSMLYLLPCKDKQKYNGSRTLNMLMSSLDLQGK